MFDGMHDGWMWGMHWGWWIFWLFTIAVVVWAVARSRPDRPASPPSTPTRETPLETLQRRYAEGEISTEEYEERKRRLQNGA